MYKKDFKPTKKIQLGQEGTFIYVMFAVSAKEGGEAVFSALYDENTHEYLSSISEGRLRYNRRDRVYFRKNNVNYFCTDMRDIDS